MPASHSASLLSLSPIFLMSGFHKSLFQLQELSASPIALDSLSRWDSCSILFLLSLEPKPVIGIKWMAMVRIGVQAGPEVF